MVILSKWWCSSEPVSQERSGEKLQTDSEVAEGSWSPHSSKGQAHLHFVEKDEQNESGQDGASLLLYSSKEMGSGCGDLGNKALEWSIQVEVMRETLLLGWNGLLHELSLGK